MLISLENLISTLNENWEKLAFIVRKDSFSSKIIGGILKKLGLRVYEYHREEFLNVGVNCFEGDVRIYDGVSINSLWKIFYVSNAKNYFYGENPTFSTIHAISVILEEILNINILEIFPYDALLAHYYDNLVNFWDPFSRIIVEHIDCDFEVNFGRSIEETLLNPTILYYSNVEGSSPKEILNYIISCIKERDFSSIGIPEDKMYLPKIGEKTIFQAYRLMRRDNISIDLSRVPKMEKIKDRLAVIENVNKHPLYYSYVLLYLPKGYNLIVRSNGKREIFGVLSRKNLEATQDYYAGRWLWAIL